MFRLFRVLRLAATGVLFGPSATANVIPFQVELDGADAGTVSPGTGIADLLLDDVANTLDINLTYSGLLSPTTNAHIHCCAPPGSNAGVIIPFIPEGFVTGVTSGSFVSTFLLTPLQVADIESGLSYINIHTVQFRAGEIRGQIAVPEPAPLSLLAAALVAALVSVGGRRARSKPAAARVPIAS
jgi:hypothetical protein